MDNLESRMMYTIFPQVEAFRNQLQILGADFVCTTSLPDASVLVAFLGQFQGQTVLWNMTLATLQYFRQNENGHIFVAGAGKYKRPFIEIKDGNKGVFQLQVGLDLETINETVIKKTIIMIRNYKRLAHGRIEFGSTHT